MEHGQSLGRVQAGGITLESEVAARKDDGVDIGPETVDVAQDAP